MEARWCLVVTKSRVLLSEALSTSLKRVPPPFSQGGGFLWFYRFAWPRANFLTFGFFDPRGYSRGLSGLSALRFFRAVRFVFLRSSLLSFVVFAMNSFCDEFCNLVIG